MPEAQSPVTEELLCREVEALLAAGRYADADRTMARVLAVMPEVAAVNLLFARSLLAQGGRERLLGAWHAVELVLRRQPESAAAYAVGAQVQQALGNRAAAEVLIRVALVFDNRTPAHWHCYEQVAGGAPAYWPSALDVVLYAGHPCLGPMPLPSDLAQKPVGGSESVLLLLAQTLAAQGLQVAVCSNYAQPATDRGVHCLPLADFYLLQRYADVPVAIVSRFPQPFLNQCTARRRIFWLHDIVAESYAPNYARMDPQVDEYWALSDYQQQMYQDRCGLPAHKFWQTTNAIDAGLFPPRTPLTERIAGRLMYTSRPGRGLAPALQVYARLRETFPHLSLQVCTYTQGNVWDDPELQAVRPLLESLPGVTLASLGKAGLVAALAQSVALLYPNTSEAETSCLAAIEAQMAGTPVVTTARGCLRETVEDGVTGFVVPWSDDAETVVADLTAAMTTLLTNDRQWDAMSRAAHHRAQQRHDAQVVARQWRQHLGV